MLPHPLAAACSVFHAVRLGVRWVRHEHEPVGMWAEWIPCCGVCLVKVIANMEPFRENEDGTKGERLPNIASGEGVDIVLDPGR